MPGISVSDTYDALLTTTLRNYRKKLIDNIFEPMRFLKWLMRERGKGKEIGTFDLQDGGYQIVEHLMYEKNTTIKWYSGYETLDTTPQEGLTVALYNWKEVGGTIAISRKEQRQNSGKHQLLSLLEAKTKQAEMSIRDQVSSSVFADLTTEPTKAITPILLLASPDAATTTVGGISGTTYGWWRNYQADCGSYGPNLESKMRTAFNTVAKDGNPDCLVCTQNAYEYYESLGTSQKRFDNEKATLDLGFEVLKYKGADMFFDFDFAEDTPATGAAILFLNSEFLRLVVDKESNFVTGEFIEPENQTAKVAKIFAMLNLTTNKRRALGVLHGIDA